MDWNAVKTYILSAKGVPNSQIKDTQEALLQKKWFFDLSLTSESVIELLPKANRSVAQYNSAIKALMRVATDGESAVLCRVMKKSEAKVLLL